MSNERDEAVDTWSGHMRDKLEEHKSKGSWKGESPAMLQMRLLGELEELNCAMSREEAMKEAADVANYAFMIAENTFPEDRPDGG